MTPFLHVYLINIIIIIFCLNLGDVAVLMYILYHGIAAQCIGR